MTKTLLAVDDSATMRKVLEITFSGEDFRVITADGGPKALGQMSEEPVAVVIDTSLGGEDAYALAKDVRARDARAAIVLMASRYNPYDVARGRAAGADDFIDKPFDTQALIDKVKKAIVARESGAIAAAPAPVAAAPAAPAPPPVVVPPFAATPRPPVISPGPARPAFPAGQRSHTLSFEGGPAPSPPPAPVNMPVSRTVPSGVPIFQAPVAPAAPAAVRPPPAPPPVAEVAAHAALTPAAVARAAEPTPIGAAVNGQLAGKLGALGLSPEQAQAVLSLSREVVERVVWEVVPQLAETIIKEEIARLTRDA